MDDTSRQFHQDVLNAIEQHQLLKALTHLKAWISSISNWELSSRLEEICRAYQALLHFYTKGFNDEQRFYMQDQFFRQTYSLNEAALRHVQLKFSNALYYSEARKFNEIQLEKCIEQLENKQQQLIFSELTGNKNATYTAQQKERQNFADNLFLYLWTSPEWTRETFERVQNLFQNSAIHTNDKLLCISALTLALNHTFDTRKFILLILLFLSEKGEAAERALVGIAFTFIVHKTLITAFTEHNTFPELNKFVKKLTQDACFRKKITNLQIQLIIQHDTEKKGNEIENNIVPNIIKSTENLGKKPTLEELEEMLDENDEETWPNQHSSSKYNESIQNLIDLKDGGVDLYFNSFKRLKAFSFFNNIANWVRPFSKEHTDIASSADHDGTFIRSVLGSDNLCSSDTYSFLLMFSMIPNNQKDKMHSQMNGMFDNLFKECVPNTAPIQDDEDIRRKYIQDCYRFFKLFRYRNEFNNPFDCDIFLANNKPLRDAFTPDNILQLANYAAKQKDWLCLLAFLKDVDLDSAKGDLALLKGTALQNTGFNKEAAEFFNKAYSPNVFNEQLARRLARCLRTSNQSERAAAIYARLSEHLPENGCIAYYYGLSLLYSEHYEKAIKQFQKAYYLNPNQSNCQRALAWTYLVTKQLEQADKHYQALLSKKPIAKDFLNAGHTALAMGNIKNATKHYMAYHRMLEPDTASFSIPSDDMKILMDIYGIDIRDIQFITDYINSQDI